MKPELILLAPTLGIMVGGFLLPDHGETGVLLGLFGAVAVVLVLDHTLRTIQKTRRGWGR